mgnify:CR=1 FL=1
MSDAFEKALNIEPVQKPVKQEVLPPQKEPVEEKTEVTLSKDAQDDYDLSRNTFRDLITKGNEALDGINELAKLSENPRAYEVLATVMKTIAETTRDLYDLHKKTKDLKQLDVPGKKILDNGNVNIDKAVFVGTTTDLLKSIKDQDNNA